MFRNLFLSAVLIVLLVSSVKAGVNLPVTLGIAGLTWLAVRIQLARVQG